MANRKLFTDFQRKTVYANGNGKCAICGRKIDFADMTVDHKIPLSKGGTNDFDNLQAACLRCNAMKNSMTMKEMVERIFRILLHNKTIVVSLIFAKKGDTQNDVERIC